MNGGIRIKGVVAGFRVCSNGQFQIKFESIFWKIDSCCTYKIMCVAKIHEIIFNDYYLLERCVLLNLMKNMFAPNLMRIRNVQNLGLWPLC